MNLSIGFEFHAEYEVIMTEISYTKKQLISSSLRLLRSAYGLTTNKQAQLSRRTSWQSSHQTPKSYLKIRSVTRRHRCMQNRSPNSILLLLFVLKLQYRLPIFCLIVYLLSSLRSFVSNTIVIQATRPYQNTRITTDELISLIPSPCFQTTDRAVKLNPTNDAWKYLIRKFQNIVFLILMKNSFTLGLFLETTIASPITATAKSIPIADRATPSRLQ